MTTSQIQFATIKLINGIKHLSEGMANNVRNLVCHDLNIPQSQENFNIINEAIECYFKASNSLMYK